MFLVLNFVLFVALWVIHFARIFFFYSVLVCVLIWCLYFAFGCWFFGFGFGFNPMTLDF